jgi:hypothetical protein
MKKEFNVGDLILTDDMRNIGYIVGQKDLYEILWMKSNSKLTYSPDILSYYIQHNSWKHYIIISENK